MKRYFFAKKPWINHDINTWYHLFSYHLRSGFPYLPHLYCVLGGWVEKVFHEATRKKAAIFTTTIFLSRTDGIAHVKVEYLNLMIVLIMFTCLKNCCSSPEWITGWNKNVLLFVMLCLILIYNIKIFIIILFRGQFKYEEIKVQVNCWDSYYHIQ